MPASSIPGSYSGLMKEHYLSPEVIENERLEMGPLATAMIDGGDTKAGGKTIPFPVIYGGNQGRSANFPTAQGNSNPLLAQNFQLTRFQDYGVTYVDRQTMLASDSVNDAFFKDIVEETDGIVRSVCQSLAITMYRDGSGIRGQVGVFGGASATCTLADVNTAILFEQGMVVVAGPNANGAGLRNGQVIIGGIQYSGANEGQLSATSDGVTPINWDTAIPGFQATDYLFVEGDAGAVFPGILGWAGTVNWTTYQIAAPGATPFFQVNRSLNSRLYGLFYDGSQLTIVETIQNLVAQLKVLGAKKKKTAYLHPIRWTQLSESLQAKGIYPKQPDDGVFGFRTLTMATAGGDCEIFEDIWCPYQYVFVLQEENWELLSVGEVPHLVEEDIGNYFLRTSNADSFEVRVAAYPVMGNHAPTWTGIGLLPN